MSLLVEHILGELPPEIRVEAESVFLVGSCAENLESLTSDIDIYVVIRDDFLYRNFTIPPALCGRRAELSFFSLSQYQSIIGLALKSPSDWSPRSLEVCYKFVYGKVLCAKQEFILRSYQCSIPNFERNLSQYHLRFSNAYYDDCIGHLLSEKVFACMVSAQSYLYSIVDAWLAGQGERYPKPQHRPEKCRRAMSVSRFKCYVSLCFPEYQDSLKNLHCYLKHLFAFSRLLFAELHPISQEAVYFLKNNRSELVVCDYLYLYERKSGFYVKNRRQVLKLNKSAFDLLNAITLTGSGLSHDSRHVDVESSGSLDATKQALRALLKSGIVEEYSSRG